MSLAEHTSLVQRLLDRPGDQQTLLDVHESLRRDPRAYVDLLVSAANATSKHVAASQWLTEAARVQAHALNDRRSATRKLEAALDRDPLNLRATDHLIELYRAHPDDAELRQVLGTRAAALQDRYHRESMALPRAALAFEKLSSLYEAIDDSAAAIAALRTALELERARSRHTIPSPPPDGPPESSFRAVAPDPRSSPNAAPPPESPWTVSPESDARDTLPVPGDRSPKSTRASELSASAPPASSPRASSDPLLSMIESLHALRHSDDVVEGAALVLRTVLGAIPATSAFVHVMDVATRDYVVVAASGEHNADLIGARTTDADPILSRALREMQAVAIEASASGWLAGSRFRILCPERGVLCAPVHFDGRHLGAIELVDPTRNAAFTQADRHALTYVGERLGEFLADRSLTF